MPTSIPKATLDNRSNQLNPLHPSYYLSRSYDQEQAQALAKQQVIVIQLGAPAIRDVSFRKKSIPRSKPKPKK